MGPPNLRVQYFVQTKELAATFQSATLGNLWTSYQRQSSLFQVEDNNPWGRSYWTQILKSKWCWLHMNYDRAIDVILAWCAVDYKNRRGLTRELSGPYHRGKIGQGSTPRFLLRHSKPTWAHWLLLALFYILAHAERHRVVSKTLGSNCSLCPISESPHCVYAILRLKQALLQSNRLILLLV